MICNNILCRYTFTLCFIVLLHLHGGCLKPLEKHKFTSEELIRLGNGKRISASIEIVNRHQFIDITSDATDHTQRIMHSLTPIIVTRDLDEVEPLVPEYVFHFQSGRHPLVFEICICGERLCYQSNGYYYEGGHSEDLKKVLNELFKSLWSVTLR